MAAHQDLPPPGGFGTVATARTFVKGLIAPCVWVGIMGVWTYWGIRHYAYECKRRAIIKTELLENYVAVEPFLLAERERKFLRQLRNNREAERELMKDDPNWEVGTYYGDRLYVTLPPNSLPPVPNIEYMAHRPRSEAVLERIPDRDR